MRQSTKGEVRHLLPSTSLRVVLGQGLPTHLASHMGNLNEKKRKGSWWNPKLKFKKKKKKSVYRHSGKNATPGSHL